MSEQLNLLNLQLDVEKKLNHIPEEAYHMLTLAKITKVEMKTFEVGITDDNGNPSINEFSGLTVPRLSIDTERLVKPWSLDKHHREDTFSWGVHYIKNSTTDTMIPQKDVLQRVSNEFMQILHIHGVLRRHFNIEGQPPVVKEIDLKLLNSYNPFCDAKTRVEQLTAIFTHIVEVFNCLVNDKPMFTNIELAWALIPGGMKRSKYVLPQYVGKGFVEIFKNNTTRPAISISPNVIMKLGELKQTTTNAKAAITAEATLDVFKDLHDMAQD